MCRNIYCVIPEAPTLLSQISRIGNSQHAGSFIARGSLQLIAVYASLTGYIPAIVRVAKKYAEIVHQV